MICPKCKNDVEFNHLHDTAHGIEGTHMDGSERYVCSICGYSIYKYEGEKYGLTYRLD